jgi:diacylglycerol kinase family enzyme
VGNAGKDILLFANPIAGRGKGAAIAARVGNRLAREGFRVRAFSKRADQVADADLMCDERVRAVVVIGGDGTLRTVAGRLCMGAPGVGGAVDLVPPLLVVPLGTANLMGRHLGVRWDDETVEHEVAAAVRRGKVVHIDTARANGNLLLLVAGVGMDGRIIHELDKLRSGPISYLSYGVPAALALGTYDYPPLTVVVDGKVVFEQTPGLAFIGNIAEYGTGFAVLPHARPDDGVLDVCAMPCRSGREIVEMFLHAAAGEHLSAEGVVYAKGKHVRVESPAAVPVQVDGEPAGHTPLDVDLLAVRVAFIVP